MPYHYPSLVMGTSIHCQSSLQTLQSPNHCHLSFLSGEY